MNLLSMNHPSSSLKVSSASVLDCGPSRTSSRSVSWNATGFYLAVASSDRMARLYTIDYSSGSSADNNNNTASGNTTTTQQQSSSSSAREVLVISGHTAPVTKVRFHPHEACTLLTAAADQTVRLWDCRQASQRACGTIQIDYGNAPVSLEWCRSTNGNSSHHHCCVTECNGKISVYDTRQLSSSSSSSSSGSTAAAAGSRSSTVGGGASAVCTFEPATPYDKVETTIFSPDGNHLIAAVTRDGMGDLDVWNWKEASTTMTGGDKGKAAKKQQQQQQQPATKKRRILKYPAHSGPIYAMDLSPDGSRLATGGCDALVGLWDCTMKKSLSTKDENDTTDYFADPMNHFICTHTIRRRIKFFLTVAFSHDGKLVASSSEENDVDIAQADTGASVGLVNLACGQQGAGAGAASSSSSAAFARRGGGGGGAEEVAWHPKDYILASARTENPYGGPSPLTPVAVAKLSIV